MQYYVYAYLDPRKDEYTLSDGGCLDHEPFYIGKGKGKRAWCHLDITHSRNTNRLKKGKIKRIYDAGFVPKVVFLSENMSEDRAMLLEQEWIARIGTKWTLANIKRGPLCNMTSGGDGYTACEELRALQRVKNSGEGNPMYGKTHSETARKKISEQSKKLRHTDNTKKLMSEIRGPGGRDFRGQDWIVVYPDGSRVPTGHLRKFCAKEKLPYGSLYGSFLRNKPITRCKFKGFQLLASN